MTMRRAGAMPIQIIFWSCFLVMGLVTPPLMGQTSREVTQAMVQQWMTDLSNWGRWGDDDQMGTLNLITQEKNNYAYRILLRNQRRNSAKY